MRTQTAPRPIPAPRVVAHRGASAGAPENTAAAFDLALQEGADTLELDIQQTADGELVAWHDDTLERTVRMHGSIRSGWINRVAFDEIALCDVGQWFNDAFPDRACSDYVGLCALRLEDVLRRYAARVNLFIELKHAERFPTMVPRVMKLLDGYGPGRHHILSSDAPSLIKVHCEAPDIPLVQLLPSRGPWTVRLDEVSRYAGAVSPLRTMVGADLVATAKESGLAIYPHTVNDPNEMRSLLRLGVDGIITDRPGILKRILGTKRVELPQLEGSAG